VTTRLLVLEDVYSVKQCLGKSSHCSPWGRVMRGRWSRSAGFVAFLAFLVLLVCLVFASRGPMSGNGSIALQYEGRTNMIAPFFYGMFENKELYLTGEFAVFVLRSHSIFYQAFWVECRP